jgi:hypothetical protein
MPTPPQNPQPIQDPSSGLWTPASVSFDRQVGELVKSMKELVEINKNLLITMKTIAPPVGTKPGTTPRPRSDGGPSGGTGGGKKGPDYDDREQTEETFGPSPLARPRNPRSNDTENASRGQRSYFTEYLQGKQPKATLYGQDIGGVGGPGINEAQANAVSQGAMQGFRLPRYGEFNTQDILNLAGNATASAAEGLAKQAATNPGGVLGQFANSNVGQKVMGGLGSSTRLLNGISNIIPYTRAFQQLTGIPTSLSGQNAEGTAMGYNQGGTNVGPFRIPGIGIGLKGLSISPAMTQGIQNSWQAFKYGLTPGGSSKLMTQMQGALQGEGWSGSTMRNMAGQYGQVAASQNFGNIGTPQELAPIMDQLVRYGSGGLDNLTTSLKKIPNAALAANQSISQTVQGLNTFAQAQQSMGATYAQGFNTAANMSVATGATPATNQQLLSNPLGQAFASEMTGGKVPAFVIGSASGATQMAGQFQAMTMLQQAYKSAGYSPQVVDAMVGQQWGMSPEATANFLNNHKEMTKSQTLLDQATKMNTKNNLYLNHDWLKPQNANLQGAIKTAKAMGFNMTPAQIKQMEQYTANDAINHIGSSQQQNIQQGFRHELAAMNEQKTTPQLWKEAHALGMSKAKWKSISEDSSGAGPFGIGSIVGDNNVSRAGAGEISNRLSGWIKNNSQAIQNRQNLLGILELTPDAKKLVNLNLSNFKNTVNSGGAQANSPAATSSMPNSTYASTPGGFTPAGAGVGVSGGTSGP